MNRNREGESASVTAQTAALILFCAILAASCMGFLSFANRLMGPGAAENALDAQRSAIDRALAAARDALSSGGSPGSDSPLDKAYALSSMEGCQIEIRELSSKLNPNWIRKSMLEDTELSLMLRPGRSPSDIQQRREDGHLAASPEGYADFFKAEDLKEFLTVYSYANVNSADEFALRGLCLEAGASRLDAESFHGLLQGNLVSGKLLDERELSGLLGTRFLALKPLLTAQGQMNVNFLPERILKAILSYPAWAIPEAARKSGLILQCRQARAIDGASLEEMLGVEGRHAIFSYLGTRSWFWALRVKSPDLSVEAVFARRLPFDPGAPEKRLALVWMTESAR
jgi:hypothetical protein